MAVTPFLTRPVRRGHRKNAGIRVRPLYQRCRRCRPLCAVRSRLAHPTIRHLRRVLRPRYGPNRVWSHPDLGGSGFPRAKGPPSLGLRHLDPWDNDGFHGFGGNRASKRRHRMVVAAGNRPRTCHERICAGPRRLHRVRLRPGSTRCLTPRCRGPAPLAATQFLLDGPGSVWLDCRCRSVRGSSSVLSIVPRLELQGIRPRRRGMRDKTLLVRRRNLFPKGEFR